jgi:hypothetical protein
VDLNRLKKMKLAYAPIAIFALGCAYVFFVVGMIGDSRSPRWSASASFQSTGMNDACGSYHVICVYIDLPRLGSCQPHYIGGGGGRRTTPYVGQATPSLQKIFCDSGLSPKTTPAS